VPYRDALIAVRLTDIQAPGMPDQVLVYAWAMRDNQLVDGAWQVGRPVKVRLIEWSAGESTYGGHRRLELADPDADLLEAYWAEPVP
jgi:hypothetical protein